GNLFEVVRMKRIFYYFERDIRKWSREPDRCCGFSCDAGGVMRGVWDCAVSATPGFEGNLVCRLFCLI
ncbi:MAG: hypothetical protein U9N09_05145, partial [Euryarchaeota archaeon]|nr:hypothetical protein [Euryarchaeota archaeon]